MDEEKLGWRRDIYKARHAWGWWGGGEERFERTQHGWVQESFLFSTSHTFFISRWSRNTKSDVIIRKLNRLIKRSNLKVKKSWQKLLQQGKKKQPAYNRLDLQQAGSVCHCSQTQLSRDARKIRTAENLTDWWAKEGGHHRTSWSNWNIQKPTTRTVCCHMLFGRLLPPELAFLISRFPKCFYLSITSLLYYCDLPPTWFIWTFN